MSFDYSYPTLSGNQRPANPSPAQVSGTVTQLLYGRSIHKCPIPVATANGDALVVFHSPAGKFGLSKKMLSKHLLLLGGIGSGKTNTIYFIVEELLKSLGPDELVIIFDSKGDFYKRFYDPWNPNHIVVGNDARYSTVSKSWNIFDELRNRQGKFDKHSELAAKEIAKSLFVGRESQNQPFFSQAATDVVAKVLIDFIRHQPEKLLNNAALVQFFRTANVNFYHAIIDRNRDFESARDYFGPKGAALTPQALGVLSYISAMVNDVFVGMFGEKSAAGSFSMRQLVRQKGRKVMFLEYDLSVGEILGPIYGLLYDMALKEALSLGEGNGSTYLICDEFRILPKLTHISDALNMGRSLGIKVIAGLQTINQFYDIYGEEMGKTLAAGFMSAMCFLSYDLDTRKFITERFGENYMNMEMHSLSQPVSVQREGHTVEDWDILNLQVGDAFVNLSGYAPFKFHFDEYKK